MKMVYQEVNIQAEVDNMSSTVSVVTHVGLDVCYTINYNVNLFNNTSRVQLVRLKQPTTTFNHYGMIWIG